MTNSNQTENDSPLKEQLARILHDANTGSIVPDNSDPTKYGAMADALIAEGLKFNLNEKVFIPEVNSEKVWKFYWDCGRQGSVDSIFVARESELKEIYGKTVYFGEVLGKHSEVYGDLESSEFSVISDDPKFVELFKEHIGSTGHNPFDYLEDE